MPLPMHICEETVQSTVHKVVCLSVSPALVLIADKHDSVSLLSSILTVTNHLTQLTPALRI